MLRAAAPAYAAADASRNRLNEGDYDSALILIREARKARLAAQAKALAKTE